MNGLKQRFSAGLHEQEVDLGALALLAIELLAVSADPKCAVAANAANRRGLQRLEELKTGAQGALVAGESKGESAQAAAAGLVRYLGKMVGFTGNSDDYYNPDNSNLGWVLAERCGIPITLSIVYMVVGRALGYDVRGIGFPGHFLVEVHVEHDVQLIDAFSAELVSRQDCMQTYAQMLATSSREAQSLASVPVDDTLFVASSPQQILLRLLENLKQIHLQARATGPTLAALELQILLAPESFELRSQHDALVSQVFGRQPGQNKHPELH